MTKNKQASTAWIVALLLTTAILVSCSPVAIPTTLASPPPAQASPTPTSVWEAFLQTTPFAYFTPLPPSTPQAIDGTYAKIDQSWPQWWRCMRCADYRSAGGIWKLQFDKGVMRIFYEVNNWRSLASYSVAGDRLFIFNDPYCPEHTGEYQWKIENGNLTLVTVQDVCAFDGRSENLSAQSWLACTESSTASAEPPPGCEISQSQIPAPVTPGSPLHVAVYGGDSRFFETPPELRANANAADTKPPEGVSISYAEETIPYGLQRVLWWNGPWIEVTSEGSYTSMGVQFLGEQAIGWARVLFDGQEVWRGNTSDIWSKYGRHGGYVEVSGFGPGKHTLRVESLNFDYRPVTVASFGFSTQGGVKAGEP